MKKVLIISYYFLPGNFAGSYRIAAWAKYLNEFGYHPIIVTRHWNPNDTNFTSISNETEVTIEQNNEFTVYRVPFKGYKSDILRKKYGKKLNSLWRLISFIQIILESRLVSLSPSKGLYYEAEKILRDNQDIKLIITSGRPFFQFKFAKQLIKKFRNVKWIADYRDPWNSNTNIDGSFKRRFLRLFEKNIEKKCLKSANCFITCSEGFRDNIQQMFDFTTGYVVTNGFDGFVTNEKRVRGLKIAYIGSLYDNQAIEQFLIPLMEIAKHSEVSISFYGLLNQQKQKERIDSILKTGKVTYNYYGWIEKSKLMDHISEYNAFLLCGIPSRKGTYTAKFFDYLSFQKNIILCPSDNDVLESTILDCECGWVLRDEQSVKQWYRERLMEIQHHGEILFDGDLKKIEFYKYENQVRVLSEILDKVSVE